MARCTMPPSACRKCRPSASCSRPCLISSSAAVQQYSRVAVRQYSKYSIVHARVKRRRNISCEPSSRCRLEHSREAGAHPTAAARGAPAPPAPAASTRCPAGLQGSQGGGRALVERSKAGGCEQALRCLHSPLRGTRAQRHPHTARAVERWMMAAEASEWRRRKGPRTHTRTHPPARRRLAPTGTPAGCGSPPGGTPGAARRGASGGTGAARRGDTAPGRAPVGGRRGG